MILISHDGIPPFAVVVRAVTVLSTPLRPAREARCAPHRRRERRRATRQELHRFRVAPALLKSTEPNFSNRSFSSAVRSVLIFRGRAFSIGFWSFRVFAL